MLDTFSTIPVGALGIIALPGCKELGEKIDKFIIEWRNERIAEVADDLSFAGYYRDTFLIDYSCIRFGSGEAKAVINESVRGLDIFILCDVFNHGVTYKMYGQEFKMSPDDHYQDLKRVIASLGGKARRISVIMPMLYEGRQHKRTARESLDCAIMLQELRNMGVENIITFDAHDARVQNAIPMSGFENFQPAYQMIKALVNNVPDIEFKNGHTMIVSPDEGGIARCTYFASILGIDLGMFYKRRDYTKIVNGKNPIAAHEYLGTDVSGKDVIIVDDMISSGDSVIDIAKKLKALNANRIFVCTSFGLFCEGLERFDVAHKDGFIEKVFTTNLVYRTPELLSRDWYCEVDVSKYIAYIVDTLNHDTSVSELLDPSAKITRLLEAKGKK